MTENITTTRGGASAGFVVILRGGPGVGKTTIARALADRIPRSAQVEQDELRYMVRGGLVSARAGRHPAEAPDEYERQCRLADTNAFLLARSFADAGFVPIIAGLDGGESASTFRFLTSPGMIPWTPSPEVLERHLSGLRVVQFILDAAPATLRPRLARRGLDLAAQDFVLAQRASFLDRIPDLLRSRIVETSTSTVEEVTERLLAELGVLRPA